MEEKERQVRLPLFGLPRLVPFVRPYKKLAVSMVLLGVAGSLMDAAYPLFNRYAINHFVAEKTLDTLVPFILVYLAVLAIQSIDNYVNVFLCGKIEMYLDRDLRNAAFGHLQKLSFSYFNQNSVGYIHARIMSDSGKIGEMIAWRLMDLVWYGSYLVSILAVMLTINRRLACYVLLLVPVAVLVSSFFQKKLLVRNRIVREQNARITGDLNEGITGAKSIKTLGIRGKLFREFQTDTETMRKAAIRASHVSALFTASVTWMSSLVLAVVLWQGGRITMEGVMEIGTLSVFMSYALSILEPVQNMVNTIAVMISIQVNIERYTRLLETTPKVKDSPEVMAVYGDSFAPKRENWEELQGEVEFEDVSFHYPDGDELVLEHFSLKVPRGTNVAIVGETGAGKSTLVNLVCRFYEPTKGRVLIDGRDARERSLIWLHSHIGYVLQTPHLFSGSVRENLRYGNPSATDEEIWQALKLVSAEGILDKMDAGLDSDVGEGGDLLSTGEKQLLSFARALLANPRILILDEATSSVDTVTEKLIQDAIQTVIRGRTSFVIAHRLSTIVHADVILVVQDGKIVEQGRHEELMRARGTYYELYTRQYEELAANMISSDR